MPQSKHEFYFKGISGQKRPDIVIDLRRPDKKKLDSVTTDEELIQFLNRAEASFMGFKEEILSSLLINPLQP